MSPSIASSPSSCPCSPGSRPSASPAKHSATSATAWALRNSRASRHRARRDWNGIGGAGGPFTSRRNGAILEKVPGVGLFPQPTYHHGLGSSSASSLERQSHGGV